MAAKRVDIADDTSKDNSFAGSLATGQIEAEDRCPEVAGL
jgi:hypothetical protein